MISAFALGGAVLNEPRYAEAARRAAEFLDRRACTIRETGILLRRYRQGEAAIPGFLDDYALFAQALLDLYEAQFDLRHLELAIRLTEKQRELFEDARARRLLQLGAGDEQPGDAGEGRLRRRRAFGQFGRADEPAAAGADHQPDDVPRIRPQRSLAAFGPRLTRAPVALPQMLAACEFLLGEPRQIVVVGEKDARRYAGAAAHAAFAFRRRIASCCWWIRPETRRAAGRRHSGDRSRWTSWMGQRAAYVCRNYTCQLPVSETAQFAELLQ